MVKAPTKSQLLWSGGGPRAEIPMGTKGFCLNFSQLERRNAIDMSCSVTVAMRRPPSPDIISPT